MGEPIDPAAGEVATVVQASPVQYSQAQLDSMIAAAVTRARQEVVSVPAGPVVPVINPGTERDLFLLLARHTHFHDEADARLFQVTLDHFYPAVEVDK